MPRRYINGKTVFFFLQVAGRLENNDKLVYNSIKQISFQKSINQKKEKMHRYPLYHPYIEKA